MCQDDSQTSVAQASPLSPSASELHPVGGFSMPMQFTLLRWLFIWLMDESEKVAREEQMVGRKIKLQLDQSCSGLAL